MMNNFDDNFLSFMNSLEIDLPKTEKKETKENAFQYTTRSFLCNSDIKKIPFVVSQKTNKISNFITEIIFTTSQELTDNVKKKYGLRRSFKI